MTNIDQLHKIALEGTNNRRQGKTYYTCSLVVGEVGLNPRRVIAILPKRKWFKHVAPMIKFQLKEQGFKIIKETHNSWLIDNGTMIKFIYEDDRHSSHFYIERDSIVEIR